MGVVRNQSALRQLRQSNVERVLALLRAGGPRSRAEIGELTGLSRTTLSGIVGGLLEDGVLVEGPEPRPSGGRGRPVQRLSLNPRSAQAIGIEIGRERIYAVLADAAHEVTASGGRTCPARADVRTRARAAADAVRELAEEGGIDLGAVAGIGLGTPGPGETAEHGGRTRAGAAERRAAPRSRQALADLVSEELGAPVLADNNSRLTALGEAVWGAAAGAADVLHVALSYGVGGGLVVDGRLFRGSSGAAGEIGHICVDAQGPACWCGGRGCLERYASLPAVLRAAGRRSRDRLQEAVAAGEDRACAAVEQAGAAVGRALAAACTTVNPERIVLGGEVAALGPRLLDPAREAFRAYSAPLVHRGIGLTPAQLDDRGGALGGLALVLRESPLLAGYADPAAAQMGAPTGASAGTSPQEPPSPEARSR
ncbi:ROK family transcriptional regulator [Streptomyces sp. ODS28]|uniref:ROK family transcriptional regulator n=1 Tax=Streptomyces sp. ODS28 TaxID=3136688 RepID=UPI0031E92A72